MKTDYHVHSLFSADSTADLADIARSAVNLGYGQIAVTEHFDFMPQELAAWGLPPIKKYKAYLDKIREAFPSLEIIFGVEVGEYHRIKNIANQIFSLCPPDLKIGSVHLLGNLRNTSVPFLEPFTQADIKNYYEENLLLCESGDFHILGHLGVYKRYWEKSPAEDFVQKILEKIFSLLIKNEIALEVNTSGLRKPLRNVIPEPHHLALYKKTGGRLITIGSDLHRVAELDVGYRETLHLLKDLGFSDLAVRQNEAWTLDEICSG